MSEIGHVHEWSPKRYVDHCHYEVAERVCVGCGDVNELSLERDFDLNPLQIAFARQDCARCRDLLGGIEPASWREADAPEDIPF